MNIHFLNLHDNDTVISMDKEAYVKLLKTKNGYELADAVKNDSTVVDNDPRPSLLEATEAFFPYNDVVSGYITGSELLDELDGDWP